VGAEEVERLIEAGISGFAGHARFHSAGLVLPNSNLAHWVGRGQFAWAAREGR
jgi:hypothetical protein